TVADDHILAADVTEHGRAHFSSKGAFALRIKILGTQTDETAAKHLGHKAQVRKRRTDCYCRSAISAQALDYSPCKLGSSRRVCEHLPVTDDDFLSHAILNIEGR